jgi:thiol-disulfide isomerase/thioredoxin
MEGILLYLSYAFIGIIILYISITYLFKKQLSFSAGMFSFDSLRKMTLNNWMLVGGIAIFIFIAWSFYQYYVLSPSLKPKYSANNEGEGFSNSSSTAELMFFFADWCPHCKEAKPIWNDLKAEYETKLVNGTKIVFTEIDCSEETPEVENLMNKYNIEGYPTVKLLKDGKVIEYDAKPTKENLHKFLETVV